MRPVRLLLDGFGCYRQPTEADLSDVEFFALVGPTGAGKSTLIDGLCFALYGTVPRWGNKGEIKHALAPAANLGKVSLVFEAAGKRYGVSRAITRDAKGHVKGKAALDLLDPAVEPDAAAAEMLGAVIESLAEGSQVTAKVEEILGLTYEHFTQSVLLPQGRFAEFLHAKASDRQDLLVELLAFGIYTTVGQAARERAKTAAEGRRVAMAARAELVGATPEAEGAAVTRIDELAALAATVQERLSTLAGLAQRAHDAAGEAERLRADCALLVAVRMPAEVPDLARRIATADRLVAELTTRRAAAESAADAAQQAREALGDKTALDRLAIAYQQQRDLAGQLSGQEKEAAARQAAQADAAGQLAHAQHEVDRVRDDLARAERSDMAAALAQNLHVGEDCPVCRQRIAVLPARAASADLAKARAAVEAAQRRLGEAQSSHQRALSAAERAASAAEATRTLSGSVSAALAGAPAEADVLAALAATAAADEALGRAQVEARSARTAAAEAERERSALDAAEKAARAELGRSRDSVVALRAPEMHNADLAADWASLTGWAGAELERRRARLGELDDATAAAQRNLSTAQDALRDELAAHGIAEADSARAAAAVAAHLEGARRDLTAIRQALTTAARLDAEIAARREEELVAAELGNQLRSDKFERWLCGEALDFLVAEASLVLLELSAGQYELDRDERNDLVVVDHSDAGARRPVHTLSGGETFQASLALALALSKEVVGLSAGQREMNSMFLDEGFGTLDEDTLETVGTTLERLAEDSDRMIGIVTHVPALAERAPVRFVVSRNALGSELRKERL